MRVTLPSRFSRAGPWTLMAVMLGAVALGTLLVYTQDTAHSSMLFYFYLPVAVTAVILGRLRGLILAAVTVAAVGLPSIWLGLVHLVPEEVPEAERFGTLAVWAVFLAATAWLVGWVSERGGSLSLTQGLGSKAIKAIEQVRRRTGQDIHDGIAQYAAAAFLEAEVLEDMATQADPQVRAQVQRVKQPLGLLVTEARAMVGSLRPPVLGPDQFLKTLGALVENFESRTGISCDLETEGDFAQHSDSMRICIYRSVQEGLSNIERHSGATSARIWTRASRGGVQLVIKDNGSGFTLEHVESDGGNGRYGLSGIQERARYLGGTVSIRTAPGEGTTVNVYVPSYRGEKNDRTAANRSR